LLIRSELLVIHEVTNGPFVKENTTMAPFAPPENESVLAHGYMQRVSDMALRFRCS
jgi:hypothetical protein